MNLHEIGQLFILLFSWVAGCGIFYLYLKNSTESLKFSNLSSAFLLSAAVGAVVAFAGVKANISFWLVWIVYAIGGAFATRQFLKKKPQGVYGRGISDEDKHDYLKGLRNVAVFVAVFCLMYLIGESSLSWAIIPLTPVMCGGAAYLLTDKDLENMVDWGFIGLVAGVGFYLAL